MWTVHAMVDLFPSALASLVLGVLGVLAGVALAGYAARRTVAQPLALALDDEVQVLVGVLADLRRLPYLTPLNDSDFAAGAHQRIWAALLAVADIDLSGLSDAPSDSECAAVGEKLAARSDEVHAELQRRLGTSPSRAVDLGRLAHLAAVSAEALPTDAQVLEAASAVMQTGSDRARLAGPAPVVATLNPDSADPAHPPLARFYVGPTRLRRVLSGAVAGAVAAILPGLAASAGLSGPAAWIAVAALCSMSAGSLVLALVDFDTMYVDLRTMVATGVVTWVLAPAAALAAGDVERVVAGVVVVAVAAVFFELMNRIHRWVRGTDGLGFGDTLILLVTAGIPSALTGDPMLALYSLIAGCATFVLAWVCGALAGKVTRHTPMAFGPYLAASWVLGWLVSLLLAG